jgi:hypothetical protein
MPKQSNFLLLFFLFFSLIGKSQNIDFFTKNSQFLGLSIDEILVKANTKSYSLEKIPDVFDEMQVLNIIEDSIFTNRKMLLYKKRCFCVEFYYDNKHHAQIVNFLDKGFNRVGKLEWEYSISAQKYIIKIQYNSISNISILDIVLLE